MNKPDSYMPFYALDFWQAVRGWPARAVIGYLKAITHYWFHEHCIGLKDNAEYLQGVCELTDKEWNELGYYELIFDNNKYFKKDEENNVWHQYRCLDIWNETVRKYEAQINKSKLGAAARWSGHKPKHMPKHRSGICLKGA